MKAQTQIIVRLEKARKMLKCWPVPALFRTDCLELADDEDGHRLERGVGEEADGFKWLYSICSRKRGQALMPF